jgi:hypothetical protein
MKERLEEEVILSKVLRSLTFERDNDSYTDRYIFNGFVIYIPHNKVLPYVKANSVIVYEFKTRKDAENIIEAKSQQLKDNFFDEKLSDDVRFNI